MAAKGIFTELLKNPIVVSEDNADLGGVTSAVGAVRSIRREPFDQVSCKSADRGTSRIASEIGTLP